MVLLVVGVVVVLGSSSSTSSVVENSEGMKVSLKISTISALSWWSSLAYGDFKKQSPGAFLSWTGGLPDQQQLDLLLQL